MKERALNRVLIVLSVGIILLFYLFNVYSLLHGDDIEYSFGIHSIFDIIKSQYIQYFYWTGRTVAFFLAKFWILVGKPFFNVANTLVYCAFILLVQFHITGKLKKPHPGLFLAMNVFFWYFTPAWGHDFLWLNASCIYLWTAFFILLFLVPFRKKMDNPEYKMNLPLTVLSFPAGILAGWSVENSSAAVLVLLIAYFIIKFAKKEKFALFEILGATGFLIGFSMLVAAPGKYGYYAWAIGIESGYYDDPFFIRYIKRFIDITGMCYNNYMLLLMSISVILGFDLVRHQKRKLHMFSFLYALAALASAYSMLLAPFIPERAFLIVLVFSVITLGNVLVQMELRLPNVIRRYAAVFLVIVLIPLAFDLLDSGKAIIGAYLKWYDRLEYILAEKEKGNLSIVVRPILVLDKHAILGTYDIRNDEEEWPNPDYARYFGIESIKTNDEKLESAWLGSTWEERRRRIRQLFISPWGIIRRIQEIE